MVRDLATEEREILEFLLSKEFPGREELLAQLDAVRVEGPSCRCGCDSIGLVVDEAIAPAAVPERVPTEAFGRDPAGAAVGVLLHVIDGYMRELEFYVTSDEKTYGRPTRASLELAEWSPRDESGARWHLGPGYGHRED